MDTCPVCGGEITNDPIHGFCDDCEAPTAVNEPGHTWVRFEGGPDDGVVRLVPDGFLEGGTVYSSLFQQESAYVYDGLAFQLQEE